MAWNLNTLGLLIPLLFLLVGLTVTMVMDPYISKKHRVVMEIIIALSITLIAQNLLEEWLAAGPLRWFWRTTTAIYGYTIRPVFLILILYIVEPEKKHLGCWGLVALNGVLHLTAYFSPLVFHIDEHNHFQGGRLHAISYVIYMLLLGIWLFKSIQNYRTMRKRDLLIPVLVVLMIFVSVYLDRNVGYAAQPVTFLTFTIVICSVFYYIWLHLRFVREHEEDLRAQQRIQIMLSQIQPHFLYNALAVIQDLCRTDPHRAEAATVQFAKYLRGNMDSLQTDSAVSFERELEHTQGYLELEKMRFEDKLTVEYDIQCTDFELPTLTLQPIVENAVRHGVRGNADGKGTVTITTQEYPDRFEIAVADNGPGFDLSKPGTEERSHIGLRNVRERLERMCGGTLTVKSVPGAGTTVTITLPKEGREK